MTSETPVPTEENIRLAQRPDWVYLLREYYELYRFLSAGGSSKIRTHQRAVREAISKVIQANVAMTFPLPERKPVVGHMRRALDEGLAERHASCIRAIMAVQDALSWQYGYGRMPKGLSQKYAYAEITGPSGPVITEQVILGLVLFAPGCTYPAHAHDGITESYVCLSGSVSENHQGVYSPGSLIYNPPDHRHRITVADHEPALLAYAWHGPQEKLAGQVMSFRRA